MQFVNNEPNQIEIRKSQNTLIVVGTGVIIFSIWTAVKMLGLLFLLRNETVETLREKMGPIEGLSDKSLFWMLVGISVIVIALLSGVRMYIGLSAIAVGRGKRRGWLYILAAVVMIIGNICAFFIGLFSARPQEQLGVFSRDQSLSTFIIDVTSLIMLTQMVISAVKIRKLTGTGRKEKV